MRAYAFAGGLTHIILASHDGALDLTTQQTIDELVDIFQPLAP